MQTLVFSLLLSLVNAGLHQLQANFQKITEQMGNETMFAEALKRRGYNINDLKDAISASMDAQGDGFRSGRDESSLPTNRQFQGLIAPWIEDIDNYGCWCYFDDGLYRTEAHSPPQDDIDEKCRLLINGYKCAEHDALERGEECDAQTVIYTPYNFFTSVTDLETDCNQNNADICQRDACIIEGSFTLEFFDRFFLGIEFDPALKHVSVSGPFDPQVECVGIPNPTASERSCCGTFNIANGGRVLFRHDTGFTTRSCCGNDVINNLINDCCSDQVQPVGTCPGP